MHIEKSSVNLSELYQIILCYQRDRSIHIQDIYHIPILLSKDLNTGTLCLTIDEEIICSYMKMVTMYYYYQQLIGGKRRKRRSNI
jgi:hypothetical protein